MLKIATVMVLTFVEANFVVEEGVGVMVNVMVTLLVMELVTGTRVLQYKFPIN